MEQSEYTKMVDRAYKDSKISAKMEDVFIVSHIWMLITLSVGVLLGYTEIAAGLCILNMLAIFIWVGWVTR